MNAMTKGRQTGFTLIEAMIVVAVIAILAALAYPSYKDYVRKSRRSDAISELLRLQLEQEKHRANNTTYTTDWADLGGDPSGNFSYYVFTLPAADATTYTIQAAAQSDQTNDKERGTPCSTMTIDQNGVGVQAACFKK